MTLPLPQLSKLRRMPMLEMAISLAISFLLVPSLPIHSRFLWRPQLLTRLEFLSTSDAI
jgi:hypothetical protein